MLPKGTLKDRVAIITGGGTGIGFAIATEFARLGAKLVLASRSAEHLEPSAEKLRAQGADVLAVTTDVREPAQVDRLCQETLRRIVAAYAWTGGPGTIHSASAKAGVVAMTRTLAVEWARYKIRSNAISPGPVETSGAGGQLWAAPEVREAMLKTVPRGRIGRPEEVAHAAAYLVSDYADFITGEVLVMDGGQWLGKGMFGVKRES